MNAALIPVKRLEQSKSRLVEHLPDDARQALTLAMLEDLLEALGATRGLDRIAVTTPDPLVAERAAEGGAEVLWRPEPGLNAALEDGRRRLELPATAGLLIVLGDVAGARARDFEALLERSAADGGAGVWLAPSADGGTSALLQRPPDALACRFGAGSAKRHHEAAQDAGLAFRLVPLDALAIDLDEPEDLERFLASEGGGPRTRALLRRAATGASP